MKASDLLMVYLGVLQRIVIEADTLYKQTGDIRFAENYSEAASGIVILGRLWMSLPYSVAANRAAGGL